jgi:hypothetical protein
VIYEIEDYGFVVGAWALDGDASGSHPYYFCDFRDNEGSLIRRAPIPENLYIGDFCLMGKELYILTYHIGLIELPTIRIFKVDIDGAFRADHPAISAPPR